MRLNVEGIEILFMFLLIASVFATALGFHNMDNAWNMQRLGVAADCLPSGECLSSKTLYNLGVCIAFIGVFGALIMSSLLGYYVGANKAAARS